ncbi:hypothetical protein [Actinomadura sp. RB99]|uniref:hypothetical protein n=1 Tax=Actinomadura sp. RB99 TaxID=2691577 RepID=UPI001F512633|nr:hypothetical protein [Actinomadura sp. RB99]
MVMYEAAMAVMWWPCQPCRRLRRGGETLPGGGQREAAKNEQISGVRPGEHNADRRRHQDAQRGVHRHRRGVLGPSRDLAEPAAQQIVDGLGQPVIAPPGAE